MRWCAYYFVAMGACRFLNVWTCCFSCLAHGVASGLEHTSKRLPEATIGCEVLLRGHSAPRTPRDSLQQSCRSEENTIPARIYGSCHATFSACFCSAFFADSSLRSAVVRIMDSIPNTCADAVRQERFLRRREHERQQISEETAKDRAFG